MRRYVETALLRIGAREEGLFRHHMTMPDGRIRDSVYFSIADDEWPAVKARLEGLLRAHSRDRAGGGEDDMPRTDG